MGSGCWGYGATADDILIRPYSYVCFWKENLNKDGYFLLVPFPFTLFWDIPGSLWLCRMSRFPFQTGLSCPSHQQGSLLKYIPSVSIWRMEWRNGRREEWCEVWVIKAAGCPFPWGSVTGRPSLPIHVRSHWSWRLCLNIERTLPRGLHLWTRPSKSRWNLSCCPFIDGCLQNPPWLHKAKSHEGWNPLKLDFTFIAGYLNV